MDKDPANGMAALKDTRTDRRFDVYDPHIVQKEHWSAGAIAVRLACVDDVWLTAGQLYLYDIARLSDTAGIHQTEDAVEKIGVERARAAARQASLAWLVLVGACPLLEAVRVALALARQAPNLLVAVNKSALPRAVDIGRLADEFDNVVSLSARSGEGVSVLCDAIGAMYPAGEGRPGELLTNARPADAESRALTTVRSDRSALRIGMTPDVVLTDAEAALEALGELNGKHIRDDLIQTIFSRFCVG